MAASSGRSNQSPRQTTWPWRVMLRAEPRGGTVWRRKGMGVGGWEGERAGHPAGVGVESEGLGFQGNWKVCEWDKFRGEGVSFRDEYSLLTHFLHYSGHASKKWITFTLVAKQCLFWHKPGPGWTMQSPDLRESGVSRQKASCWDDPCSSILARGFESRRRMGSGSSEGVCCGRRYFLRLLLRLEEDTFGTVLPWPHSWFIQ